METDSRESSKYGEILLDWLLKTVRGLTVEQGVETRAEDDARAVAVPGCTACSAVTRARRHVAWLRRAGGSVLRARGEKGCRG